jgi:hypothetical protein
MTRLIPRIPSPDTESNAELKLFDIIKTSLSDDWVCFHSLGLASHRRKPWAEIDFVLVGPPGVFCLEIKGGRVAREGGLWWFTNRKGDANSSHQGPFDQVGGASSALRNYLTQKMPECRLVAFGYGVVMPDVTFVQEGPDIVSEVLLDQRGIDDFSKYVERLVRYWHDRLERRGTLAPATINAIAQALRGDFDFVPSLRAQLEQSQGELLSLTQEQYSVLDGLSEGACYRRCRYRQDAPCAA